MAHPKYSTKMAERKKGQHLRMEYRFSPFRSLGQSLTDRRVYMVFAHAGKNAQKNTGSSEKLPVK